MFKFDLQLFGGGHKSSGADIKTSAPAAISAASVERTGTSRETIVQNNQNQRGRNLTNKTGSGALSNINPDVEAIKKVLG